MKTSKLYFIFALLLLICIPSFALEPVSGKDFSNKVLFELNHVRQNPQDYIQYLEAVKKKYKGMFVQKDGILFKTQEGIQAVTEAIKFLQAAKPLPPLLLSNGLSRAALDHVIQQGMVGQTGHTGNDGLTPDKRIQKYGSWLYTMGENISYGSKTPRKVVLDLIIDDGVPNRGHRANIFNQDFKLTGIAYGPHTRYDTICVITFAGGFVETSK